MKSSNTDRHLRAHRNAILGCTNVGSIMYVLSKDSIGGAVCLGLISVQKLANGKWLNRRI